jgi:hypothetical protein
LQWSISPENIKIFLKVLGVPVIITGKVSPIGQLWRLEVRALSVQNGQVQGQFNRNIDSGGIIDDLTSGEQVTPSAASSVKAGGKTATASATSTAAQTAQTEPTYKIGDTGPAGGIIFYDKKNNSGGWRYLEAAPASTETKVKWAMNNSSVENTRDEIGTGKQNTQLIVDFSLQTGINMPAARYCDKLTYGGHDDWYLPSKLELGLLFLNLKDAGIGGFSGERYWSSSDTYRFIGDPWPWAQQFSNGEQKYQTEGTTCSVRAIRQF